MKNHLKKEHKIDVKDRNEAKQAVYDENIAVALKRQPVLDEDRKRRQFTERLTQSLDKKTLEYLYIRWIIAADISFAQANNDDFRSLLQYINAPANALLPRSASTISSRAFGLFYEGQKRMKIIRRAAASSVHIACDAWSSPNDLGMLAIVSHFLDENFKQQAVLLALKELPGQHTGENMAQTVLDTLDSFEIKNSLGYSVKVNAETNDAMLKCISRTFLRDHGIVLVLLNIICGVSIMLLI